MSELTNYPAAYIACAKRYCPKDWNIYLWKAFYGDCVQVIAEDKEDDEEWIDSLYKCYDVPKELVENVIQFINSNVSGLRQV